MPLLKADISCIYLVNHAGVVALIMQYMNYLIASLFFYSVIIGHVNKVLSHQSMNDVYSE